MTDNPARPPWYDWLHAKIGLKEFAGPADNPAVTELWKIAQVPAIPAFNEDETPWCAGAVGAALFATGFVGTRSAMARSYAQGGWGFRSPYPIFGAVTVIEREPKKPPFAHVGFLAGCDMARVALLGGNQGDAVSIATFARSRVIGYYWPNGSFLIRPTWINPAMPAQTQAGGSVV